MFTMMKIKHLGKIQSNQSDDLKRKLELKNEVQLLKPHVRDQSNKVRSDKDFNWSIGLSKLLKCATVSLLGCVVSAQRTGPTLLLTLKVVSKKSWQSEINVLYKPICQWHFHLPWVWDGRWGHRFKQRCICWLIS